MLENNKSDDLTLSQLKDMKLQFEEALLNAVKMFEKESGLNVLELDLLTKQTGEICLKSTVTFETEKEIEEELGGEN